MVTENSPIMYRGHSTNMKITRTIMIKSKIRYVSKNL